MSVRVCELTSLSCAVAVFESDDSWCGHCRLWRPLCNVSLWLLIAITNIFAPSVERVRWTSTKDPPRSDARGWRPRPRLALCPKVTAAQFQAAGEGGRGRTCDIVSINDGRPRTTVSRCASSCRAACRGDNRYGQSSVAAASKSAPTIRLRCGLIECVEDRQCERVFNCRHVLGSSVSPPGPLPQSVCNFTIMIDSSKSGSRGGRPPNARLIS